MNSRVNPRYAHQLLAEIYKVPATTACQGTKRLVKHNLRDTQLMYNCILVSVRLPHKANWIYKWKKYKLLFTKYHYLPGYCPKKKIRIENVYNEKHFKT